MKHALVSSLVLLTLGFTATAFAAPPAKSSILHCGCTEDGSSMVYTPVTISAKSKGHDAHVVLSPESCFDGIDVYTDFVRTGSDCQVSGPALAEPIELCSGFNEPPVAGDTCGEELIE